MDVDTETFDLNAGDDDPVDYNIETKSEPAMPTPMEFDVDEPAVRPRTRSTKKEADMSYDDTDDQTKHQNLLLQCQRFADSPRFGSWLKTCGFTAMSITELRKRTIEELEELLTRMQCACLNRGNSDMFVNGVLGGLQFVETAVAHSPWKDKLLLTGLKEMCSKNEVLLDALSIYEITHNMTAGSPIALIAWSLFSCGAQVHSINTFLKHRQAIASAQHENDGAPAEETKTDDDPDESPLDFDE